MILVRLTTHFRRFALRPFVFSITSLCFNSTGSQAARVDTSGEYLSSTS